MSKLPKLDFLYLDLERTEENYMNRREIYYTIVDWDERHFEDYAETCSFEELVYLMIYIYKDKFPRDKFHSIISLDSANRNLLTCINENKRRINEDIFTYNNFMRKEVTSMNVQFHTEEYSDEEVLEKYCFWESYMQNLFLEFNKEVPIHVIDKALEGKEYTKSDKNDVLLYEVKDSPIASLEVTKNSIKLNINEEKVILYFSIY
ncbi:hypothetical protein [Flavobacterium reichenbachii]|uniref:Uncharacterized protein n=1 Tax=Flavobacterium reichenbachii TaxID=362418 RepID=A0A085ZPR6_9FLAO|nr:hypothetical protein [Flavobacterium reichenbachii]KFF06430.1 hypothetical protein IW19_13315 [Flavobacterium reichenbachii]OXB10141.1 hypothetical protein B0A68_22645 [Flavobacterium reichenbachii]